MDLGKALQNLYAERQRLEQIITALQELQQGDRGRDAFHADGAPVELELKAGGSRRGIRGQHG